MVCIQSNLVMVCIQSKSSQGMYSIKSSIQSKSSHGMYSIKISSWYIFNQNQVRVCIQSESSLYVFNQNLVRVCIQSISSQVCIQANSSHGMYSIKY
jgi:hypothetical protein